MASAEHQRAQQLGLAGAGRADDQAVRAHAVLRGLLEVQLDRLAVGVRCRSAPAAGPGSAGAAQVLRHVQLVRVAECRAARRGRSSELSAISAGGRRRTAAAGRAAGPAPRPRPAPARRPGRSRSAPSTGGAVQPTVRGHVQHQRWRGRAAAAAARTGRSWSRPSTPPSVIRWSEPAIVPPSSTTSTCGPTAPGRSRRGRTGAGWRAGRRASPPARRAAPRPAGAARAASCWSGCRACGSHFTHSHCGRRSGRRADRDQQVVRRVEHRRPGPAMRAPGRAPAPRSPRR